MEDNYILVLASGKVVEFGPPAELLRAQGAFYNMVQGIKMSGELKTQALKKKHKNGSAKQQKEYVFLDMVVLLISEGCL